VSEGPGVTRWSGCANPDAGVVPWRELVHIGRPQDFWVGLLNSGKAGLPHRSNYEVRRILVRHRGKCQEFRVVKRGRPAREGAPLERRDKLGWYGLKVGERRPCIRSKPIGEHQAEARPLGRALLIQNSRGITKPFLTVGLLLVCNGYDWSGESGNFATHFSTRLRERRSGTYN
jgi:hypothetical protein